MPFWRDQYVYVYVVAHSLGVANIKTFLTLQELCIYSLNHFVQQTSYTRKMKIETFPKKYLKALII